MSVGVVHISTTQAAASSSCTRVHVAINSAVGYERPRKHLVASLVAAGVPMSQVHVFIANSDAGADRQQIGAGASGERVHHVAHNSFDFTGLTHIVENPQLFRGVQQWFYMHDTFAVGPGFWPNITRWCASGLPACALPLTRWHPSASAGLYDAAFLARPPARALLVGALKNTKPLPASRWKQRAIFTEDKLFKVCDAQSENVGVRRFTRQCYNRTLDRPTCICSRPEVAPEPVAVYGDGSAPRQAWQFACADVTKYKANWARNRTLVMTP